MSGDGVRSALPPATGSERTMLRFRRPDRRVTRPALRSPVRGPGRRSASGPFRRIRRDPASRPPHATGASDRHEADVAAGNTGLVGETGDPADDLVAEPGGGAELAQDAHPRGVNAMDQHVGRRQVELAYDVVRPEVGDGSGLLPQPLPAEGELLDPGGLDIGGEEGTKGIGVHLDVRPDEPLLAEPSDDGVHVALVEDPGERAEGT